MAIDYRYDDEDLSMPDEQGLEPRSEYEYARRRTMSEDDLAFDTFMREQPREPVGEFDYGPDLPVAQEPQYDRRTPEEFYGEAEPASMTTPMPAKAPKPRAEAEPQAIEVRPMAPEEMDEDQLAEKTKMEGMIGNIEIRRMKPEEMDEEQVTSLKEKGVVEDVNKPASWYDVAKAGYKGTMSGVTGGLMSGIGTGMRWIGSRTGWEGLRKEGADVETFWQDVANKHFERSKRIEGSLIDRPKLIFDAEWWAYNFMQNVPALAASIIPGAGAMKWINVAGQTFKYTPQIIKALAFLGKYAPKDVKGLALLGGSIVGGGAGGIQEGADLRREMIKKGASESEADLALELMTLASAGLNAISSAKILNPEKIGKLKKFLLTGSVESLTEYFEEPASATIKYSMGYATPAEWLEQIKQGVNVMPIAFVAGGGAGVVFQTASGAPASDQEIQDQAKHTVRREIRKANEEFKAKVAVQEGEKIAGTVSEVEGTTVGPALTTPPGERAIDMVATQEGLKRDQLSRAKTAYTRVMEENGKPEDALTAARNAVEDRKKKIQYGNAAKKLYEDEITGSPGYTDSAYGAYAGPQETPLSTTPSMKEGEERIHYFMTPEGEPTTEAKSIGPDGLPRDNTPIEQAPGQEMVYDPAIGAMVPKQTQPINLSALKETAQKYTEDLDTLGATAEGVEVQPSNIGTRQPTVQERVVEELGKRGVSLNDLPVGLAQALKFFSGKAQYYLEILAKSRRMDPLTLKEYFGVEKDSLTEAEIKKFQAILRQKGLEQITHLLRNVDMYLAGGGRGKVEIPGQKALEFAKADGAMPLLQKTGLTPEDYYRYRMMPLQTPVDVRNAFMFASEGRISKDQASGLVGVIEAFSNYVGVSSEDFISSAMKSIIKGQESSAMVNDSTLFQTDLRNRKNVNEQAVADYLDQYFSDGDFDVYMKEVLQFVRQMRAAGWAGEGALMGNEKTLLSIDFTTNCPFARGGNPCIYCYVAQPRTAVDELGIPKEGSGYKERWPTLSYTDEILRMPQPLVDFLNLKMGGLRIFSFADYIPAQHRARMQRVIEHAQKRGLMLKIITKNQATLKEFGNLPGVSINYSLDFDPKLMYTKLDRIIEAFTGSRRGLSHTPTIEEAKAFLKQNKLKNVKLRYVATNLGEAVRAVMDPDIDVVTMYHGRVGDQLFKIWQNQNKSLLRRLSPDLLQAWAAEWGGTTPESLVGETKKGVGSDKFLRSILGYDVGRDVFHRLASEKMCCQTKKCGTCNICCGFKQSIEEGLNVLNSIRGGDKLGSITFEQDSKAVIRFFSRGNIDTAAHELGHLFRRYLAPEDMKIAADECGVKDGFWDVDSEERFSDAWVTYLREGKAPNKPISGVMEKFKNWLTEIYRHFIGLNGGFEVATIGDATSISGFQMQISPQLREVFDRMMGGQYMTFELMAEGTIGFGSTFNPANVLVARVDKGNKSRWAMGFGVYKEQGKPVIRRGPTEEEFAQARAMQQGPQTLNKEGLPKDVFYNGEQEIDLQGNTVPMYTDRVTGGTFLVDESKGETVESKLAQVRERFGQGTTTLYHSIGNLFQFTGNKNNRAFYNENGKVEVNSEVEGEEMRIDPTLKMSSSETMEKRTFKNAKEGIAAFVNWMKSMNRIVDDYVKGSFVHAVRQVPTIFGNLPTRFVKDINHLDTYRSPAQAFFKVFGTKFNPVIDAVESSMAYFTNMKNSQAFMKDVLNDIKDSSKEVMKVMNPLFEKHKALMDEYGFWMDEERVLSNDLKKQPDKNSERAKWLIAERKKAREKLRALEPLFKPLNDEHAILTKELALKHADVRIYLAAAGELPEGVTLNASESIKANQIEKWMLETRDKLDELGIPVIKERKYMTRIWKALLEDTEGYRAFMRFKAVPTTLKFMSRMPQSKSWIPSTHASMEAYIPVVEWKIAFQPFTRKWTRYFETLQVPVLKEYARNWMDVNLYGVADSWGNRILNGWVGFEYARLIGLSTSVAFKHFLKLSGTWTVYGTKAGGASVTSAKTMVEAFLDYFGLIKNPSNELRALRAYVNQMAIIRTMDEITNLHMRKIDTTVKAILSQPVVAVESFDNGVSVFAGLAAGTRMGMDFETLQREIWQTILDVNFRSGWDQPLPQKKPGIRALTMFQMTPFKLLEFKIRLLKNAFSGGLKGTRDAFGTHHRTMFLRYILIVGMAETIMRRVYRTSILESFLHIPYMRGLFEATPTGYHVDMKEWKPAKSPAVSLIEQTANKGLYEGGLAQYKDWGQFSKVHKINTGEYSTAYEDPLHYLMGWRKIESKQERTTREKKQRNLRAAKTRASKKPKTL